MRSGSAFLLATACGLVLAGMVHIGVVLGVPAFAERDAVSRLQDTLGRGHATLIDPAATGGRWPLHPDPAVTLAACAFDLREGPLHITAPTAGLVESLAFFARGGTLFSALGDQAAVKGALDIQVMTAAQAAQADEADNDDEEEDEAEESGPAEQALRIVAPKPEGLVLIRVLAQQPSERSAARETAKAVSCKTLESAGE